MASRTVRIVIDVTLAEIDSKVTEGICDPIQEAFYRALEAGSLTDDLY